MILQFNLGNIKLKELEEAIPIKIFGFHCNLCVRELVFVYLRNGKTIHQIVSVQALVLLVHSALSNGELFLDLENVLQRVVLIQVELDCLRLHLE